MKKTISGCLQESLVGSMVSNNLYNIILFDTATNSLNIFFHFILGSLEEARTKTNMAQFLSDLSANEDSQHQLKSKSKMESPPALIPSKLNFLI